jgi:hypothetical protein
MEIVEQRTLMLTQDAIVEQVRATRSIIPYVLCCLLCLIAMTQRSARMCRVIARVYN